MDQHRPHIDPAALAPDIDAYRTGDEHAGDRLANALRNPLDTEVRRFLGDGQGDVDDVVQDALVSTLQYLRNRDGFAGDPVRLAVTIARNRCRDLHRWRSTKPTSEITPMSDWLEDGSRSILDELVESERMSMLQRALDGISRTCRRLLHDMYVARIPTDAIRERLGLSTVQGVYYRRTACLDEAKKFLQPVLADRSPVGRVGGLRRKPRPER